MRKKKNRSTKKRARTSKPGLFSYSALVQQKLNLGASDGDSTPPKVEQGSSHLVIELRYTLHYLFSKVHIYLLVFSQSDKNALIPLSVMGCFII